jgi:glutamate-1-semialdehyde 2,1-aminomutase
VISGFRLGFEGAAGHYDIQPDLLTFGKIIGGGLPVGAFAGSREIMSHISPEGPVYQAGTLSANPVAMSAGYATLTKLRSEEFYPRLAKNTSAFAEIINKHIANKKYPMQVVHLDSIFWLCFSTSQIRRADQIDARLMEYFKKLHLYLLRHGVYLGPSGYEVGFISAAHDAAVLEKSAGVICNGLDTIF